MTQSAFATRSLVETLEGRVLMSVTAVASQTVPLAPTGAADTTAAPEGTTAAMPLGGVLQKQTDATAEHALVDLVKSSSGFKNLSGGRATTDANGWPTQDFTLPLWTGSAVAAGRYNLSFKGSGGTAVSPYPTPASARLTPKITRVGYNSATGVATYTVDVPAGMTTFGLKFTNTAGRLKNLRVLQPGYALSTTQVFTTKYVNFLKSFRPDTLRLMDIVYANEQTTVAWDRRPKATDATWTRAGVPWGDLINLANSVGANIWVCVPARADNDYVLNLARMIRYGLKPELKAYVEYGNEMWAAASLNGNWNLQQAQAEVAAGGSNLSYDGDTDQYDLAGRRSARRLKEISDLFEQAWTEKGLADPTNVRVLPVIGNQAAQPTRVDQMLKYVQDVYGAPRDWFWGVGIAVYLTMNKYQDRFVNGQWTTTNSALTTDQVLEGMDLSVRTYEDQQKFAQQFAHADAYGLHLDAYEIGVDTTGPFNIRAKKAASLDPRIEPIMERFVHAFHAQGGELANWFTLGARNYDTSFGTWTITDNFNNWNTAKAQAFRDLLGLPPTA